MCDEIMWRRRDRDNSRYFFPKKSLLLIFCSDDMRKVIMEKFNPVHCEVDDLGTCGTSYQVIIVSVDIFTAMLNIYYF